MATGGEEEKSVTYDACKKLVDDTVTGAALHLTWPTPVYQVIAPTQRQIRHRVG